MQIKKALNYENIKHKIHSQGQSQVEVQKTRNQGQTNRVKTLKSTT